MMAGTDKKSSSKIPIRIKKQDTRSSPQVTKNDENISESHVLQKHDTAHLSTTEMKSTSMLDDDGPQRQNASEVMAKITETLPNKSDDIHINSTDHTPSISPSPSIKKKKSLFGKANLFLKSPITKSSTSLGKMGKNESLSKRSSVSSIQSDSSNDTLKSLSEVSSLYSADLESVITSSEMGSQESIASTASSPIDTMGKKSYRFSFRKRQESKDGGHFTVTSGNRLSVVSTHSVASSVSSAASTNEAKENSQRENRDKRQDEKRERKEKKEQEKREKKEKKEEEKWEKKEKNDDKKREKKTRNEADKREKAAKKEEEEREKKEKKIDKKREKKEKKEKEKQEKTQKTDDTKKEKAEKNVADTKERESKDSEDNLSITSRDSLSKKTKSFINKVLKKPGLAAKEKESEISDQDILAAKEISHPFLSNTSSLLSSSLRKPFGVGLANPVDVNGSNNRGDVTSKASESRTIGSTENENVSIFSTDNRTEQCNTITMNSDMDRSISSNGEKSNVSAANHTELKLHSVGSERRNLRESENTVSDDGGEETFNDDEIDSDDMMGSLVVSASLHDVKGQFTTIENEEVDEYEEVEQKDGKSMDKNNDEESNIIEDTELARSKEVIKQIEFTRDMEADELKSTKFFVAEQLEETEPFEEKQPIETELIVAMHEDSKPLMAKQLRDDESLEKMQEEPVKLIKTMQMTDNEYLSARQVKDVKLSQPEINVEQTKDIQLLDAGKVTICESMDAKQLKEGEDYKLLLTDITPLDSEHAIDEVLKEEQFNKNEPVEDYRIERENPSKNKQVKDLTSIKISKVVHDVEEGEQGNKTDGNNLNHTISLESNEERIRGQSEEIEEESYNGILISNRLTLSTSSVSEGERTRHLSTSSSLSSFEYHEREFTANESLPSALSLDPTNSPFSDESNDSKTLSLLSSAPKHQLESKEHSLINDRKITADLLKYIHPIDEGCEEIEDEIITFAASHKDGSTKPAFEVPQYVELSTPADASKEVDDLDGESIETEERRSNTIIGGSPENPIIIPEEEVTVFHEPYFAQEKSAITVEEPKLESVPSLGDVLIEDEVSESESDNQDRQYKGGNIAEDVNNEDDTDSGAEFCHEFFAVNDGSHSDSIYHTWVGSIKHLLHKAELVASLYVRLANKFARHTRDEEEDRRMQYLHCAEIAYDIIKRSSSVSFSDVLSHLLSYIGAIKSESCVPVDACPSSLCLLLGEMIKRNTLTLLHVTMITCFVCRPNTRLSKYHKLRVKFLRICFMHEISQLNVHTEEHNYLTTCFIKISDYFVQVDSKLASSLCNEYIVPYITEHNSTNFVMNVLYYMGLVKNEDTTRVTHDITSSLILLNYIYQFKKLSLLTTQKLYAFIQLENSKFQFCSTERETLGETLKMAIGY